MLWSGFSFQIINIKCIANCWFANKVVSVLNKSSVQAVEQSKTRHKGEKPETPTGGPWSAQQMWPTIGVITVSDIAGEENLGECSRTWLSQAYQCGFITLLWTDSQEHGRVVHVWRINGTFIFSFFFFFSNTLSSSISSSYWICSNFKHPPVQHIIPRHVFFFRFSVEYCIP